jgi:hypothetical protein
MGSSPIFIWVSMAIFRSHSQASQASQGVVSQATGGGSATGKARSCSAEAEHLQIWKVCSGILCVFIYIYTFHIYIYTHWICFIYIYTHWIYIYIIYIYVYMGYQ